MVGVTSWKIPRSVALLSIKGRDVVDGAADASVVDGAAGCRVLDEVIDSAAARYEIESRHDA